MIYRVASRKAPRGLFSQVIYCRGYSGEEPPLPIPNREVKLTIADGTAPPGGRVGSCGSLECRTSCDARHSSFMAGGHKPKTAALNPFRIFRYAKNTRTGRALQAQSLRSERQSAVMGPKGETMTAKTAKNAAWGPSSGTMTAVKWVRMCGKVLPVLRSVAEVAHPSGSETAPRFRSGAPLWKRHRTPLRKWRTPPEAPPSPP